MDPLREIQLTESNMLKELDALCQKHNIPYFVTYGTALGAVRHKGFIPWDDDVDVGLLRKDYDRLKNAVKEDWGESNLFLVDGESDFFNHSKIFPRIYKKNTIFESSGWIYDVKQKQNMRTPIWIDIFLYDYFDSKPELYLKKITAFILKRLYYYAKYQFNYTRSINRFFRATFKNIMHYLLIPIKPKFFYIMYKKVCGKTNGKYLFTFDMDAMVIKRFFLYDVFFPLSRIQFEDFEVNAPCNSDVYLTKIYGDYMTPPEEGNRVGHLPKELKLNTDI